MQLHRPAVVDMTAFQLRECRKEARYVGVEAVSGIVCHWERICGRIGIGQSMHATRFERWHVADSRWLGA
jgi:hypothetical protein